MLTQRTKGRIPKKSEVVFWKEVIKHSSLRERPVVDPKEDVTIFPSLQQTMRIPKAAMRACSNPVANTYQVLEWITVKSPDDLHLKVMLYFIIIRAHESLQSLQVVANGQSSCV